MLDDRQRHLLDVCIERYIADLRKACEEDQGTPDGKDGTVGHELQRQLNELKKEVDNL